MRLFGHVQRDRIYTSQRMFNVELPGRRKSKNESKQTKKNKKPTEMIYGCCELGYVEKKKMQVTGLDGCKAATVARR